MKNKRLLVISILVVFSLCLLICTARFLASNNQKYWLKMFYWDNQANHYLVKEISTISLEPQIVLDAIINDEDFIGQKFLNCASISVLKDVATVDIPSTILNSNNPPSDKMIADTLQSLAYTLCVNNDLNIKKVQYLLDGSSSLFIGPFPTNSPYSLSQEWTNIYKK